jgi:hypothetical protein
MLVFAKSDILLFAGLPRGGGSLTTERVHGWAVKWGVHLLGKLVPGHLRTLQKSQVGPRFVTTEPQPLQQAHLISISHWDGF